MNERIKELAEQATSYNNSDGWLFDKEKFAELIIFKCVDICEEYGEMGSGETLAAEILLYFGDEE